jgi:hypothetical protein
MILILTSISRNKTSGTSTTSQRSTTTSSHQSSHQFSPSQSDQQPDLSDHDFRALDSHLQKLNKESYPTCHGEKRKRQRIFMVGKALKINKGSNSTQIWSRWTAWRLRKRKTMVGN